MPVKERYKSKGVPKFLGTNRTYIFNLVQVAYHTSFSLIWKALADAPKRHQLTTLQHVFNGTAQWLSVCAPIFTTYGLLEMTLTLGLCLDHRYNLGKGICQFCLGQHTSTVKKKY